MSFGTLQVAPLLPEFLAAFPEISIDLHLSDAQTDVIGEGFDAAIRIAVQPGASLVVQRLCEMPRYLVGSPAYLDKHGRPKHPLHLAEHRCIGYSYTMTTEVWRFTKGSKSASVRPSGPLRVNNGDAMMPALIAGTGLGILPEFFLREAIESNQLERLLPDWSIPLGAVYWVTPPEGPLPKRVEVLGNYLIERLARALHAEPAAPARRWQSVTIETGAQIGSLLMPFHINQPPKPPANPLSARLRRRKFSLSSRVIAEKLPTAPMPIQPKSVLSGSIFSGPVDFG